ncbi:MAG: rod shape-determining protein MreC [Gammaproteobacteria bacterium]
MAKPDQFMFVRRLGPAARLTIWLAIGVSLVIFDSRYHALEGLRSGLSLMLQPVREFLRAPTELADELGGFFTRHRALQKERDALLVERANLLATTADARDLARENRELRSLLALAPRHDVQQVRAALLYKGHDWFAQRLMIDRGAAAGLRSGLPVIDAAGLMGQIQRVYPGSSEITLVSSPNHLTPVQVERTARRGLAAGSGQGLLELRYMPSHADVRVGDRLLTSGIDGVYPSGIPVARVIRVSRSQSSPYLRVECLPLAGLDRARSVLVLVGAPQQAAPPEPASPEDQP